MIKNISASTISCVLLFSIIYLAYFLLGNYFLFGSSHKEDFYQYWSAVNLFIAGQNPYDPKLIYEMQQTAGSWYPGPIMMWNPPWILPVLFPLSYFSYHNALSFFTLFNFTLCLVIVKKLTNIFDFTGRLQFWSNLLIFLFFPVIFTLRLGQISLILTLGAVLLFQGLVERDKKNANIILSIIHQVSGLVLLSFKPHLLYLVFLAMLFKVNKKQVLLTFFFAGLVILGLLAVTLFIQPNAISYWRESSTRINSKDYVVPINWIVSTFVGFTRSILASYTLPHTNIWPMFIIPFSSSLLLVYWLYQKKGEISWFSLFPQLCCLSLFTSPYGWNFDQSILVIPYFAIFRNLIEFKNPLLYILIFTFIQLLCYGVLVSLHVSQMWFFWLPIFWLISYRLSHKLRTKNLDSISNQLVIKTA